MAQERHNWLVDGSHTGNVYGSVRIGGCGIPTLDTGEAGLRLTIAFITAATCGTRSAGIARVHRDNGQSGGLGLVFDKLPQLVESPVAQQPAHFTRNRFCPVSNMREVFEGECLA